jgi:predicted Zn-dependent peptidase
MKPFKTLLLFITVTFATAFTYAQDYTTVAKKSADGKYTWQEVTNDPTHTRFYTLKNGLTVILAENHLEPRIMALFTTKAGSKNDPSTNTGLAHYLEHMLFKGTDKFGSLDWDKEKVELDKIDGLYEKYNKTTDKTARKMIYAEIDSVSGAASKFAIGNEYDKMMGNIGSSMTNAFTSFENTTYMENFPSNNIEKYLMIQQERLRAPVLRLFHTELEAVYEEKNIGLDNGDNKVFESMFASLFKKHPYGTQTTIGTIEHLKNPSLNEIRKYFYANYVPNNMSFILTGDLDSEKTIEMVDKYFGAWEAKPVKEFTFTPEEPRTKIEEIKVKSPDEERVAIGYLMPNANDKEAVMADLVSTILYNGKSGLLDKNLVKKQQVLEAFGFNYLLKDYGMIYFGGKPLENQSLEKVKDLIVAEIENLKKGNFDETLIPSAVNNLKVSRVKDSENPTNMAFILNDVFVASKPWEVYLKGLNDMSKITKKDVVAFANKWFGNNYTVVYKLSGNDDAVEKVEKPPIHPVEVNRDAQSPFLKSIIDNKSPELVPVFVDYNKDITKGELKKDLPLWYVPNKINNLFNAYYVLDMGKNNNRKLPLALEYLKYIGTSKMTNEQINKEMYKLAVEFDINASDDQVYITFSGLDENFDKAQMIVESLLNDPKSDQSALDKLIDGTIKSRSDATLSKDAIFWEAMENYVKYGKDNPYNNVMQNAELKSLKATELTDLVKELPKFKHKIYYYGPRPFDKLTADLKKNHTTPKYLKEYPVAKQYKEVASGTENNVFFVNYDMVQAEIGMFRNDGKFDKALVPQVTAFNEYYGGGMASVVFQDIRESKALAYSAFARYRMPTKKENQFSSFFYVGTQADKINDAMGAMNNLLTTMPESAKNWEIGKNAIKQNYATKRVTKSAILFNYQNALKLGYDHDYRKDVYGAIQNYTLDDIKKFHAEHMKDKQWNIKVIASKDKIKLDDLKKFGKVTELSLKDIFGYDVVKKVKP